MTREYAAEMRNLIDAEATGTYVPGVVAAALADKLRQTDPELLAGWLDAQAEDMLRIAINRRDASHRTAARHSGPRSRFAAAVDGAEAGDDSALAGNWLTTRFTVEDGARKPLAEMSKDDLLFAADGYEARARENKLTASFLKAVARKVGKGTVADHFSDDQLSTMWDSLAGR